MTTYTQRFNKICHVHNPHILPGTCEMLYNLCTLNLKLHQVRQVSKFAILTYVKGNTGTSSHIISSPELKAQVSFSDRLSSVVCLSVRPSVRPSVCKLFLLSTSSQEPLGQF